MRAAGSCPERGKKEKRKRSSESCVFGALRLDSPGPGRDLTQWRRFQATSIPHTPPHNPTPHPPVLLLTSLFPPSLSFFHTRPQARALRRAAEGRKPERRSPSNKMSSREEEETMTASPPQPQPSPPPPPPPPPPSHARRRSSVAFQPHDAQQMPATTPHARRRSSVSFQLHDVAQHALQEPATTPTGLGVATAARSVHIPLLVFGLGMAVVVRTGAWTWTSSVHTLTPLPPPPNPHPTPNRAAGSGRPLPFCTRASRCTRARQVWTCRDVPMSRRPSNAQNPLPPPPPPLFLHHHTTGHSRRLSASGRARRASSGSGTADLLVERIRGRTLSSKICCICLDTIPEDEPCSDLFDCKHDAQTHQACIDKVPHLQAPIPPPHGGPRPLPRALYRPLVGRSPP